MATTDEVQSEDHAWCLWDQRVESELVSKLRAECEEWQSFSCLWSEDVRDHSMAILKRFSELLAEYEPISKSEPTT